VKSNAFSIKAIQGEGTSGVVPRPAADDAKRDDERRILQHTHGTYAQHVPWVSNAIVKWRAIMLDH
jgi:hypothetical protein